jgi:hypothetical protein
MKLSNILLYTVLAAVISIAVGACAKPPTEEMDAARTAVTRAENDPDVALYAMTTLSRAREALSGMQAEADAKRYDSARNYAAEAITTAEKAIADARSSSSRSRDDSANALSALRTAVTDTSNAIDQGKRAKLSVNWNQIDGDFSKAEGLASEAEAAAAASRYRDVVEHSNAARSALSQITAQLSTTSMATTRKK